MEQQRITESIQRYGLPHRVRTSLPRLSCTSPARGSGSASEMYGKWKTLRLQRLPLVGRGDLLKENVVLQLRDLPPVPPAPQLARGYTI